MTRYPKLLTPRIAGVMVAAGAIGVSALVGFLDGNGSAARVHPAQGYVPDQALLRFTPDSTRSERTAALVRVGAHRLRRLPLSRGWVVGLGGGSVEQLVPTLDSSPGVEYAEPNAYFQRAAATNDPLFPHTGPKGGQAELRAIRAPKAWRLLKKHRRADRRRRGHRHSHHKVKVAVIDTGVALDHPDLRKALMRRRGRDFAPVGGLRVCSAPAGEDEAVLYSCVDRDEDRIPDDAPGSSHPFDLDGHGTHVAGSIGAVTRNRLGVAGVGANRVRIMPLRIGVERLSAEYTANAIAYARNNHADVVNLSLTVSRIALDRSSTPRELQGTRTLAAMMKKARRVLFVAAAGNGRPGTNNDLFPELPCTADEAHPEIRNLVCVAATNRAGSRAPYSNYGRESVDIAAPGRTLSTEIPPRRTVWREGFGRGWADGGVNSTWGREPNGTGYALSDSPGLPYGAPPIDSWARSPLLHLRNKRGCVTRYDLTLDTKAEGTQFSSDLDSYLSLEVSRKRDVLEHPTGLAIPVAPPSSDSLDQKLYVTDGSRLHVFAQNGAHMAELVGGRQLGSLGGVSAVTEGRRQPSPPDDLDPPYPGPGQVWLAGKGRSQVYKVDTDGTHFWRLGREGTDPGEFKHPAGIAATPPSPPSDPDPPPPPPGPGPPPPDPKPPQDVVYVADTGNNRVQVLDARSRRVKVVEPPWGGFEAPRGVKLSPDGEHLLIANTGANEIVIWDLSAGQQEDSFSTGTVSPADVAVSANGDEFYVTDSSGGRVHVFDGSGQHLRSLGGAGETAPGATGIISTGDATGIISTGDIWVASSAGVLAYNYDGPPSHQIRRWGLEIDAEDGERSGRSTAEIPTGVRGPLYLRFRFLNHDLDYDTEDPYDGASIDNLTVRCATRDYKRAYGFRHGTSFAAPLVTGVAALYLWRYREASVQDVIHALKQGADRKPKIRDVDWRGRLDAACTLKVKPEGRRPKCA